MIEIVAEVNFLAIFNDFVKYKQGLGLQCSLTTCFNKNVLLLLEVMPAPLRAATSIVVFLVFMIANSFSYQNL